jgi:hypothetical protein
VGSDLARSHFGHQPGHRMLGLRQLAEVFELPGRSLESQLEQVVLGGRDLVEEFGVGKCVDLFPFFFDRHQKPSSRAM